jgi:hypothetical protein
MRLFPPLGNIFMTLILTAATPETIWLLADRRLSRGNPPVPVKDDARKVMFLETDDGVAILGYAGLGSTDLGTEPVDWMNRVLRGRKLPLEQSLGVLADALKAQFPEHLLQLQIPGHAIMVPAFLNGVPAQYSIELVFSPDRSKLWFRHTRWVVPNTTRTPRFAVAGSSAPYLAKFQKRWTRSLLQVLTACDRGRISDLPAADHFATLNHEVHRNITSVGPRCVVAWRHRKGGVHKSGGRNQFYTGTVRDDGNPALPTIAGGGDVVALMGAMMPFFQQQMEAMRMGQPKELDKVEVNAVLARLPDTPDETLR